jgi:predicted dehydrogenase
MTGPGRNGSFSWGVIGTGRIATQFAQDLRLLEGTRISAVCSRTMESATRFAKSEPGCTPFADVDEFLENAQVDAVYIATPNSLHVTQALRAMENGRPVMVEKPLATSSAEIVAIKETQSRNSVPVMEAMWTRFLPAVKAAKVLVDSGRIGRLERIEAELSYRHQQTEEGRFFDPAMGGGSALDLGVYPVSLAIHFLGLPDNISGTWRAAKTGVDLSCDFVLGFGSVEAHLRCGFDRDGANAFTIWGGEGAIRLEPPFLKAQQLTVYSRRAAQRIKGRTAGNALFDNVLRRIPLPGKTSQSYRFAGSGLQFEAQAFMDACRAAPQQSDIMPLDESLAVLQVIETVLSRPPTG